MLKLSEYANRFECIRMRREDGVLEMAFHTNGGSLQWGYGPHHEVPLAFQAIANDRENKVVIITGTGADFSGPRKPPTSGPAELAVQPNTKFTEKIVSDGKRLLMNLMNIEVPVVSAINGPAWRHSEIPLLADIVLASEDAVFQDSAHFQAGLVPGDGMHIVYPLLLGPNRGRYFLLTGQVLDAKRAYDLGLVAEVLPKDQVLARAWEHARAIAAKPEVLVRNTRAVLTENIKRRLQEELGYGLYSECLSMMDSIGPK